MPFFLGLEAGFMDFLGPKGFKSHFFRTSTKVGLFLPILATSNDPSTSLLLRVPELGLSALPWAFIDYLKTANPFSLCR